MIGSRGSRGSIKYGIHVPKFDNNEIYYKSIITFCVANNTVIGAKEWDTKGSGAIVPYLDIIYDRRLATIFAGVTDIDTSLLLGSAIRTTWLFDTETEAYSQKVMCLKKIKDYFWHRQEEDAKEFETKIPCSIDLEYQQIKNLNPEYFL